MTTYGKITYIKPDKEFLEANPSRPVSPAVNGHWVYRSVQGRFRHTDSYRYYFDE